MADPGKFIGKSYAFEMHTKDYLVKTYRSKTNIKLERGTSILTVSKQRDEY